MLYFSDTGPNAEEEVASKNNDNGINHEDQDDCASVVSSYLKTQPAEEEKSKAALFAASGTSKLKFNVLYSDIQSF